MMPSLPYYGNKKLKVQSQGTNDIIRAMMRRHEQDTVDYDTIAPSFWKGDVDRTARCLYSYLKENVKYRIESKSDQTVRTPGAIIAMKNGDCKHYAQFINGVVGALQRRGYPISSVYRFAAYEKGMQPHHVFAVLYRPDGSEIWVDPVIGYDERMPFVKADDYIIKNKNMALSEISGIKLARTTTSDKDYQMDAFLTLLTRNIYCLAERLASDRRFYNEVLSKWVGMGGTQQVLDNSIARGIQFWKSRHFEKLVAYEPIIRNEYGYDREVSIGAMVGIDPLTLTALISAGTAITSKVIDKAGSGGGGKSDGPGLDAQLYNSLMTVIQSGRALPQQGVNAAIQLVTKQPGKFPRLRQLMQQYPQYFGGAVLPPVSTPAPQTYTPPAVQMQQQQAQPYQQQVDQYYPNTYGQSNTQTPGSVAEQDFFQSAEAFAKRNQKPLMVAGGLLALYLLAGKKRR